MYLTLSQYLYFCIKHTSFTSSIMKTNDIKSSEVIADMR